MRDANLHLSASQVEADAERLLRAHWSGTDWDGDVDAVKRLNPALWALYVEEARDAA
jgi:hypothetical protein